MCILIGCVTCFNMKREPCSGNLNMNLTNCSEVKTCALCGRKLEIESCVSLRSLSSSAAIKQVGCMDEGSSLCSSFLGAEPLLSSECNCYGHNITPYDRNGMISASIFHLPSTCSCHSSFLQAGWSPCGCCALCAVSMQCPWPRTVLCLCSRNQAFLSDRSAHRLPLDCTWIAWS